MNKHIKVTLMGLAILSMLSACTGGSNNSSTPVQLVVDGASTQAAQTLEAIPTAPAPIKANNTDIAAEAPTATETLTPTETATLLPTMTFTPTTTATPQAIPYACNPDGIGMSHIQINNFSGQSITVNISSINCYKQINLADSDSITIEVPIATYVVYGYIGEQIRFSVSYYVSDSIHTWIVTINPDSALMTGP